MDSTSTFLSLSRAVPVPREMEALDGAAILAGRRIPDHLRHIGKTIDSGGSLSPLGGLRPLYRLYYRRAVALERPSCGITAGKISLVDAGALGKQRLHYIEVAAIGGDHQRCHTALVLRIDRGSDIDQKPRRLDLIAIGRQVQGRVAEVILGIELGTRLDQDC